MSKGFPPLQLALPNTPYLQSQGYFWKIEILIIILNILIFMSININNNIK